MKNNDFHGEVWINAHEEILHDFVKANEVPIDGGYGNDGFSKLATELMQKKFQNADIHDLYHKRYGCERYGYESNAGQMVLDNLR